MQKGQIKPHPHALHKHPCIHDFCLQRAETHTKSSSTWQFIEEKYSQRELYKLILQMRIFEKILTTDVSK